jgi:hypothetical protein
MSIPNKTNAQLKQIMKKLYQDRLSKRSISWTKNAKYWAAWAELNGRYNAGDA